MLGMNRKESKKLAHQNIKNHYLIYLMICLSAVLLGSEFTSSLSLLRQDTTNNATGILMHSSFIHSLSIFFPSGVLGTTNGVFAHIVNGIISGSILNTVFTGVAMAFKSKNLLSSLIISVGLIVSILFWFCIVNTLPIINRRLFLEGRIYAKIPMDRFVYLVRLKKQMHIAWIRTSKIFILALSMPTIIGCIYFYYTSFLMEYVLAENPNLSFKQAYHLSKEMMIGYRIELFKWQCSLVGWYILDILSVGVSSLLYTNAYKSSLWCEFYASRRNEFHSELLVDRYLFEKPDSKVVSSTYADVISYLNEKDPMENVYTGLKGFLCKNFGLIFNLTSQERAYETYSYKQMQAQTMITEVYLLCYPVRLSPIEEEYKKSNLRFLHPNRNYTITSVLCLFFFMCFVGWIWEVSLSMITYGKFINRGVLHGPWIPIYGVGCVLILLVLKRYRTRPKVEFGLSILLCGCVEYFTGLALELTHNGQRWWDYTGYFLNINGRICAEGLLVFGLGGMAFVYLLAPIIDNFVRTHLNKKVSVFCLILLLVFGNDVIYSHFYPNTGQGVTEKN